MKDTSEFYINTYLSLQHFAGQTKDEILNFVVSRIPNNLVTHGDKVEAATSLTMGNYIRVDIHSFGGKERKKEIKKALKKEINKMQVKVMWLTQADMKKQVTFTKPVKGNLVKKGKGTKELPKRK